MGFWKSVGRVLAESATAQTARDQQKAARKETAAYLAAMAAAGAERSKGKRKKLFEQALTLKAKADAKTEAAERAGLAAADSRQQRAAEFGAQLDARAQAETNPSKRDRLLRSASFVRTRAGIAADSATGRLPQVPAAPVVDPVPASTPVVRPRSCPNCGAPTSGKTTNVCRYCGVDLPGWQAPDTGVTLPAPDTGVTIPPSAAPTQIDPALRRLIVAYAPRREPLPMARRQALAQTAEPALRVALPDVVAAQGPLAALDLLAEQEGISPSARPS